MFWAPPWSGTRALISWVDPPNGPQDELIQQAEAAAFTQDGKIFVVAEGDDRFSWWSLPGGRREAGETLEDTLRRELLEEACVTVRASELVGFQRFRHLNGDRAARSVSSTVRPMLSVDSNDLGEAQSKMGHVAGRPGAEARRLAVVRRKYRAPWTSEPTSR